MMEQSRKHSPKGAPRDLEALEKQHKEGTRGERVRQYVTPPSVNPGMFFVPR